MMYRLLIVVLVPLLSGCLSQSSLDGMGMPAERIPDAVYYVEDHGKDTRGVSAAIVEALRKRGLTVVTEEPEAYDYHVTYVDRWYWDMRMYLIDVRIDIRDPTSNIMIATARSFQTSLAAMGRRHQDIVDRAVEVLLNGVSERAETSRRTSRGRRR